MATTSAPTDSFCRRTNPEKPADIALFEKQLASIKRGESSICHIRFPIGAAAEAIAAADVAAAAAVCARKEGIWISISGAAVSKVPKTLQAIAESPAVKSLEFCGEVDAALPARRGGWPRLCLCQCNDLAIGMLADLEVKELVLGSVTDSMLFGITLQLRRVHNLLIAMVKTDAGTVAADGDSTEPPRPVSFIYEDALDDSSDDSPVRRRVCTVTPHPGMGLKFFSGALQAATVRALSFFCRADYVKPLLEAFALSPPKIKGLRLKGLPPIGLALINLNEVLRRIEFYNVWHDTSQSRISDQVIISRSRRRVAGTAAADTSTPAADTPTPAAAAEPPSEHGAGGFDARA